MNVAPLGAFGGWLLPSEDTDSTRVVSGELMACFDCDPADFIFVALGLGARLTLSIWQFVKYWSELFIVWAPRPRSRCCR